MNYQVKNASAGASAKGISINESDRRNYLANQIFDDFDFGIKTSTAQYVCKNCGKSISQDDVIFNKSICGKCTAISNANQKSFMSSPSINEQKSGGRKFRLQDCSKCFKSFWRLGIGLNHCQECFEPNFIPKTVDAHIHEIRGMQ